MPVMGEKPDPHTPGPDDPVLSMVGVGKHLWDRQGGDKFVERLRSEIPAAPPEPPPNPAQKPVAQVWLRIANHQGQEFHTARGLPFTYTVEGAGIWFFRDGRRINRKLTRAQVEIAISRCPLTSTTEIKDLMDYAYLFALLRDSRIRGKSW